MPDRHHNKRVCITLSNPYTFKMTHNHQNQRPENSSVSSHAFPRLGHTPSGDRKEATTSDSFRPLYKNLQCTGGTRAADQSEVTEDEIRKNGFQRGFVAGRQEAVLQIQQEIVPHVREFAAELLQLHEYLFCVERDSSRNIPRIIKSIAEKILCRPLDIAPDEMKALRAEILKYFRGCYQVHLILNNADADLIGQFLDSETPQWKESTTVQIGRDENVRKGALKKQTEPVPTLPTNQMKCILENRLVKASTK